jgi:hypothetical protein
VIQAGAASNKDEPFACLFLFVSLSIVRVCLYRRLEFCHVQKVEMEFFHRNFLMNNNNYKRADKSLARPTYRCILFDGENISFDTSLAIYINSTNIPPIMIINRIYETQNLLSL